MTTNNNNNIVTYCTTDDVNALFGDISDDISINMFILSINNASAWVNSALLRNHIPLLADDDVVPGILKSASIYFAASDILMSLYNGDEYQSLMDYWFNKANSLLESYVDAYKAEHDIDCNVKHRNAKTYNPL